MKWEIFIQLQPLSVRYQNTTVIAITELRIHEALRFMSASTRSASNLIDGITENAFNISICRDGEEVEIWEGEAAKDFLIIYRRLNTIIDQ